MCKQKQETISPTTENITESIYASGIVKSLNQYQVFSTVNGIIEEIYISEGEKVKKGSPLLSISNEIQQLNKENAELNAEFSDINSNNSSIEDF